MKEELLPNRAKRRELMRQKPSHKNSKAGSKQIVGGKVIHHLAPKAKERHVFSKPELKLLEIVQVRGWYGKKISKSNAQSIKNNLQQGTITEGRVLDTLRILGHDVKTIVNSKKP